MASTLLQLVNRVRRRLRAGDTAESGFDQDELNIVLVDLLNASGDAVLGQNEWSFEVRHDGVIRTFARVEYEETNSFLIPLVADSSVTTYGSLTRDIVDTIAQTTATANVQRLLIGGWASAADTALHVLRGQDGGTSLLILGETLVDGLHSVPDGPVTHFANEYLLPATVRRVLSVTHQEGDLRLEETNRSQVFDRFAKRPHELFSDRPEIVVVSGRRDGYHTYAEGADPGEAPSGASLLLWPTPISNLNLHYSYVIAYPQLSAVTDEWDGIDPMVESAIVELAYAKAMQTDVGKDVEAGVILETRALGNVKQLLAMDRQMPGQHLTLRSHFGPRGQPFSPGRMPRHFGSL